MDSSIVGKAMGRNKRREIPKFSLPLIETHCHLDYLKEQDISAILEHSKTVGVETFITISVTADNMDKALSIAREYTDVYCSQGIHPHEAKTWSEEVKTKILAHTQDRQAVVAIGEIGLDFYYDKSPRHKQREVFEHQMDLACGLNLPVIIHSRDADRDSTEVLEHYASKWERKGVIHSFTSGQTFAKKALSLGFYLGFNGIITFKNAEDVRDIVRLCPLKQMLLETDAPFLTPDPYRGKENAPFYLPFVAETIAKIKGEPIETILEATRENAQQLFQFSKK